MQLNNVHFVYCIIVLVVLIFIIWLIYGGVQHDYVGLEPLLVHENVDLSYRKSYQRSNVCSSSKFRNSMDIVQLRELERIQAEQEELLEADNEQLKILGARRSGFTSKGEALAKKIIQEIYEVRFEKVRPDFLRNPETGRNLELDMYSDRIIVDGVNYKVALEYNGKQHFCWPNSFHKTEEEFRNQVRRDIFKREMCDLANVFLITVPFYVEESKMKAYILRMIPDMLKPPKYRNQ